MKLVKLASALLAASLLSALAAPANAAIIISEVAPWASGNNTYKSDWFELTNTGASSVDITGWKMDDNSNSSSLAVALNGISSIAAGQSVIFIEGTGTKNASFLSTWFGTNVPASLLIGNYNGDGVGLSTSGDAVNIYNASNILQANVAFGANSGNSTFDNAAGLNNTTISKLSVLGVNGAFKSADGLEIGSVGAVPEPESLALMLSGMLVVGAFARKRKN